LAYYFAERELKNLKGAVTFEPLPSFVLRTFNSQLQGKCVDSRNVASADLSNVDNKLVSALHMFQHQGVE
jgi:hypothetical protein